MLSSEDLVRISVSLRGLLDAKWRYCTPNRPCRQLEEFPYISVLIRKTAYYTG